MKNFVKIACILAAFTVLLSGCGKKDASNKKKDKAENTEPKSKISENITENKNDGLFSKTENDEPSEKTSALSETGNSQNKPGSSTSSSPKELPAPARSDTAGLTYIKGVLIANKTYSLPADYAPGVDASAQSAFNQMKAAAAKEGISLYVVSGFRSYDYQATIYNNYVASDGKAEADRYSARPGHSEHQTGLSFDVNSLSQSFENTPEGKWLAANCHKYGFIIRYPKGKESITGYMYEPWHVRYLGTDIAGKVFSSGLTLEEYLGINSVYAN